MVANHDMDVGVVGGGGGPPATGTVLDVRNLSYCYGGGVLASQGSGKPQLEECCFQFARGSRVLVGGANGAGKSTLLSILGGKKMIPRGQCQIYNKDVFQDSTLNGEVMYCGDWWRTDFFFNLSVRDLLGEKLNEARCQHLLDVLQVDLNWRINSISDGQRRRCQLLEALATEKSVYIMDEITTDLDLFAREGLLNFLKQETEQRGATVFYATHIFDCLSDWATHVLFFSQGQVKRCCSMTELHDYHELVKSGTRVPLYTLIKQWVLTEYKAPAPVPDDLGPQATAHDGPMIEVKGLSYAYAAGLPPVLKDMTFAIERGTRVLVTGVNGACKSTVMSILGGKRMIPRGFAFALGKDAFNDTSLGKDVMYMGDWWRTKFYMNLRFRELLSDEVRTSTRCQYLAKILEVDFEWKINEVSDGMRRRCQLVEALSVPKSVYFMDEITSDLDIYSREGILNFLRAEADIRGATILYCTHIFDHLEGWASHILHLSMGRVLRCCPISEVTEYSQKIESGVSCPLYDLVRGWVHSEYEAIKESEPLKKHLKIDESLDGRIPNLGLAGPFMMTSG